MERRSAAGCGRRTLAAEEAHGHAEVVLAEEHDVNTRHLGDLLHVVDASLGLDLDRDDDVVVVRAGVAEEASLVGGALREVDRAGAALGARGQRVAAARDALRHVVRRVDVRDQDAVGAEVERLLDAGAVFVARDADHGLGAAGGDRAEHGRQRDRLHRAVLGVDKQPVVAGAGELLRDGRADAVDEDAKLGLAGLQFGLELRARLGRRAGALAVRIALRDKTAPVSAGRSAQTKTTRELGDKHGRGGCDFLWGGARGECAEGKKTRRGPGAKAGAPRRPPLRKAEQRRPAPPKQLSRLDRSKGAKKAGGRRTRWSSAVSSATCALSASTSALDILLLLGVGGLGRKRAACRRGLGRGVLKRRSAGRFACHVADSTREARGELLARSQTQREFAINLGFIFVPPSQKRGRKPGISAQLTPLVTRVHL